MTSPPLLGEKVQKPGPKPFGARLGRAELHLGGGRLEDGGQGPVQFLEERGDSRGGGRPRRSRTAKLGPEAFRVESQHAPVRSVEADFMQLVD
jgi:hypothetical protein